MHIVAEVNNMVGKITARGMCHVRVTSRDGCTSVLGGLQRWIQDSVQGFLGR